MKQLASGIALVLTLLTYSFTAYGQKPSADTPVAPKPSADTPVDPKSTPAYSMLILRKVKVQAQLESLVNEHSSEWPPAKVAQFELDALKSEMKKMAAVDEPQVSKLTSGYGSLVLRRVSLSTEIQSLVTDIGPEWPEAKTKQRELELLDKEIKKQLN